MPSLDHIVVLYLGMFFIIWIYAKGKAVSQLKIKHWYFWLKITPFKFLFRQQKLRGNNVILEKNITPKERMTIRTDHPTVFITLRLCGGPAPGASRMPGIACPRSKRARSRANSNSPRKLLPGCSPTPSPVGTRENWICLELKILFHRNLAPAVTRTSGRTKGRKFLRDTEKLRRSLHKGVTELWQSGNV